MFIKFYKIKALRLGYARAGLFCLELVLQNEIVRLALDFEKVYPFILRKPLKIRV